MSRIDEKRDLVTSKGILQYKTVDLINQVAKYPVLWDRLHPNFKEGKPKEDVWDEISRVFVPFYNGLGEEEKLTITNVLKNRWKNCISGLMNSVSLKRKNDRLFRPFKYGREMKFYLEARGINFSDIFDADHIDGVDDTDEIVETIVKTESEEEVPTEDDVTLNYTHKNKKAKTVNTPVTYRSSRLREKQIVLENKTAEKKTTPQNTQKIQQIKRTPTSINNSANNSLDNSSINNEDEIESADDINEEEDSNYCSEQQIYPTEETTNDHAIHVHQIAKSRPVVNESDASDQAFFESIKPALRKMNETQKLDFQIDVLQMLKTFRTN